MVKRMRVFSAAAMSWSTANVHAYRSRPARFARLRLRHWEHLEPCVRAHFARRVSVVGAESTGTTTLARDLAEHYQTVWVPEYGREYCENLQSAGLDLWTYQWRSPEFTEIARKQQELEDALARQANRILICDTDVLATGIWHERYLGSVSPEVDMIAASHRHFSICYRLRPALRARWPAGWGDDPAVDDATIRGSARGARVALA